MLVAPDAPTAFGRGRTLAEQERIGGAVNDVANLGPLHVERERRADGAVGRTDEDGLDVLVIPVIRGGSGLLFCPALSFDAYPFRALKVAEARPPALHDHTGDNLAHLTAY